MINFESQLEGIAFPAILDEQKSRLLSLLYQLDQSQWWTKEQLLEQQLKQAQLLLIYAYNTIPFYKKRLEEINFNPLKQLTYDQWLKIPILTRINVQNQGENLLSKIIPPSHGQVSSSITSGSIGQPVKIYKTMLNNLFWNAFTLRDHLWHKRDFTQKMAVIRYRGENTAIGLPPDGQINANWGSPTNLLFKTGLCVTLKVDTDTATQARWLQKHDPDYLLTYPSNLWGLMDACQQQNIKLNNLKQIRTISEMLSPQIRERCQQEWGVQIKDTYSSEEIGYMTLQCPLCNYHHVQAEGVLLEILNDENQPCKAGEIGRIVVTNFHNYAMPLIRYEIMDYAMALEDCNCGRGLPTIGKIMGRFRNMITLPTGRKQWPLMGYDSFFKYNLSIKQYQVIQKSLSDIEVKLVVNRPLTPDEESLLSSIFQESLGYPFNINITYWDEISRSKGGKFEEFISEL